VVVGNVSIGRAASIWYGAVLRGDEAEIRVGEACNIQDLCCVHVDPGEPAVFEPRVSVGHHATVHGAYLEEGSLIGMGAIVLGRARVGAGSLIAAGALVPEGANVPPGVLWVGVPGRVARELADQDRERFARTPERYAERAARHSLARWRA
jgi:carbonic anhydrase/acetyltransferase-like protein (isoleucine patch superfamily)